MESDSTQKQGVAVGVPQPGPAGAASVLHGAAELFERSLTAGADHVSVTCSETGAVTASAKRTPQSSPVQQPPAQQPPAQQPPTAAAVPDERIRKLCQDLERHLRKHKSVLFHTQHRGKGGTTFRLRASFKIGHGSTQPGNLKEVRKGNPHFVRHNMKGKNTAVCLTPVREQAQKWRQWGGERGAKLRCWALAKGIIEQLDPAFAKGGWFLVQFALIDDASHRVGRHVDGADITHQYILGLGEYTGALLRTHGPGHAESRDFDVKHRVLRVDGRLPHEVVGMDGFTGQRFSVIFYKNYDPALSEPTPIVVDPEIVFEL